MDLFYFCFLRATPASYIAKINSQILLSKIEKLSKKKRFTIALLFYKVRLQVSVIRALFTSKKFCKIGIVALSFVFDKYCSIMD